MHELADQLGDVGKESLPVIPVNTRGFQERMVTDRTFRS